MDREPHESTSSQRSLCTNCLNAPDCVLRIAAHGHVQYCDLHTVAVGPQVLMNGTAPQEPDPAANTSVGLCTNCDHVRSCVLRNPDHVVFHCQHFE